MKMTVGERAYNNLINTIEHTEVLWEAAKEAKMDSASVEIIRNYLRGLRHIRTQWYAERARWESPSV